MEGQLFYLHFSEITVDSIGDLLFSAVLRNSKLSANFNQLYSAVVGKKSVRVVFLEVLSVLRLVRFL